MRKKLGIIGGLGPKATAYLFERIIEMTKAEEDQEHIAMIVDHCPAIPDRTKYILGESGENPLLLMREVAQRLEKQCDVMVLPCVTAHYFYEELSKEMHVPLIHAIRETAAYLSARQIKTVGVLATDATVRMDLFCREFARYDIRGIYPDAKGQRDVMHLIYENVKAGREIEKELFEQVTAQLFQMGAEVLVLGCTELSVLKKYGLIETRVLDITDVLAKTCVEQCGSLKEEYQELIAMEEG